MAVGGRRTTNLAIFSLATFAASTCTSAYFHSVFMFGLAAYLRTVRYTSRKDLQATATESVLGNKEAALTACSTALKPRLQNSGIILSCPNSLELEWLLKKVGNVVPFEVQMSNRDRPSSGFDL